MEMATVQCVRAHECRASKECLHGMPHRLHPDVCLEANFCRDIIPSARVWCERPRPKPDKLEQTFFIKGFYDHKGQSREMDEDGTRPRGQQL